MSRIGNKLITVPAGVTVEVADGNEVTVKGPKGTLTRKFSDLMDIEVSENEVKVKRPNDAKHTKQLHGTTRAPQHDRRCCQWLHPGTGTGWYRISYSCQERQAVDERRLFPPR